MKTFAQNYLKARYKSTCLSKDVIIIETLFSEYPHVWWLRVGWGAKVKEEWIPGFV